MILKYLLILFSNLLIVNGYNYLNNNISTYSLSQLEIDFWFDKPLSGYHNSYPPTGINCIVNQDNYSYLISSQSLLLRNSIHEKCNSQKRTVSIFKRNLINSYNEGHLVLGKEYTENHIYKCYRWNEYDMHLIESIKQSLRNEKEKDLCLSKGFYWRHDMNPQPDNCNCGCCQKIIKPIGGLGSDDVNSCGINSKLQILYYIAGNYHNCPSSYNTQPSIVRINLTDFTFLDRNILNEIKNFNHYSNWSDYKLNNEDRYYNYPSKSLQFKNRLFLTFNSQNSGFWEIELSSFPLKIINSYQKKIYSSKIEQIGNYTHKVIDFSYMSYFKNGLVNGNILHFISEEVNSNAQVITINLSITDYFNKSIIKELIGIEQIVDLKLSNKLNKIYLLTGYISSKLYQLSENFSIIPISHTCQISSLNFPVEWNKANSMVLDDTTGIIYVFFVVDPYTGYSIVKTNSLDYSSVNRLNFYRNTQILTPTYIETVEINKQLGKIIIANKANENSFLQVYGEIKLLGCAEGRKRSNNTCGKCPKGTYTDSIGNNFCNLCFYGYSTINEESIICSACQEGKHANLLGSTDCINCNRGQFSEVTGSKNCINCLAGKYNPNYQSSSSSNCIDCDEGKYSISSSFRCNNCKLGKITSNKKYCVNCPKGRYSDISNIINKNQCKYCLKGKYNSFDGKNNSIWCIDCLPGKYSKIIGGIDISVCKICKAGKYKSIYENSGEDCKECLNGKYSALGSIECMDCPTGKYNFNNDHITCIDCLAGKFSNIVGADNPSNCFNCPVGKYSDITGLNNSNGCLSCQIGKYNEIIGSTNILECLDCPAGKIREFIGGSSLNDCINCPVGFYSEKGFSSCIGCLEGKYNNNNGNSFCKDCQIGTFSNSSASITCENCPKNSEPNTNFTKCKCIEGTYLVDIYPLICQICPDRFKCPKGTKLETLIIKQKFWRANITTLHTERCKKAYNCPGGIITNSSDDICNIGHSGAICDVCKKGWAKNEGKCFKCLTDTHVIARSYTFTILFPLIISGIIFFMIKTANPSSSEEQKEPLSGVIKIFMNYSQIFTLASSFEINWPEIIMQLYDRTKEFSSPKISFYSSDCTIGWDYYQKLLVYLLLPLGYVGIVTIILSIYSFSCYKTYHNKQVLKGIDNEFYLKNPKPIIFFKSWMITSILIGLFLAWPTIIKQTLSIIPCKKFGNKYYLLQDLSIECYTWKYTIYSTLSYIFLVLYGMIVPFIAFNLIRMKRFSLYDFNSKYEMPAPLSFLFLGYRQQIWYYEFIVMAKKYLLIVISVFLKEYARYQMISASLFIQFSFFIHVFLRPYDNISNYGILCNKLESISLLALVVTLNSGLFFGTIEQQYNLGYFEIILIVALFSMNSLVVIYFLYYLLKLGINEGVDILKKIITNLGNSNSCLLKCFSESKKNKIIKWSEDKRKATYGINLKSTEEVELFHHFFNDKKMFSHQLKIMLKNKNLLKYNNVLNKIRINIEIIEKQRCWLSILNNRLYKRLRVELSKNPTELDDSNIIQLNKILDSYIKSGLKHSKTIDKISKKTLTIIRSETIKKIYQSSSSEETSDSDIEKIEDIYNLDI